MQTKSPWHTEMFPSTESGECARPRGRDSMEPAVLCVSGSGAAHCGRRARGRQLGRTRGRKGLVRQCDLWSPSILPQRALEWSAGNDTFLHTLCLWLRNPLSSLFVPSSNYCRCDTGSPQLFWVWFSLCCLWRKGGRWVLFLGGFLPLRGPRKPHGSRERCLQEGG